MWPLWQEAKRLILGNKWDSLSWCIVLFDGTVDERSDVARSSARLISGFRDVQLAQELFEHLDRFLILRLGVGGIGRDRLHDVDGWHDVGVERIRSEEGGRFGGLWWLGLVVIRELKTDWVSRKSESPRESCQASARSIRLGLLQSRAG